MAQYHIRVATAEVAAAQLSEAFAFFKANPPAISGVAMDSMVYMGYHPAVGSDNFHAFHDKFFMVKGEAAIDFYIYRDTAAPVAPKSSPPLEPLAA